MFHYIVLLSLTTGLQAALGVEFELIKTANSADLNAGVPRGGALATILCTGLPGEPGTWKAEGSGPLPFKLAGVEVLINGALSPMISVFIPTQEEAAAGAVERIDFQVPLERNATIPRDGPLDSPLPLLRAGGQTLGGHVYFYPGPAPYPGAWFRDSAGYVIAEHTSDGSRVTPENPARPGETITAYANDFFIVWPPPPIGVPVPDTVRFGYSGEVSAVAPGGSHRFDDARLFLQAYSENTDQFCATTPALEIVFKGLAAGRIGVERIDFVVPATQSSGDWPLFFNLGAPPGGSGQGCLEARSSNYAMLPVR